MSGNILEADVDALVNAVNCVGVMGKGLALQFKKRFPDVFRAYEEACRAGEVVPGRMHIVERAAGARPRLIVNFPTKRHWREPSRMDDIESGLEALVDELRTRRIRSVAIPALGCGLGGLDWSKVRPRIERVLSPLTDVDVLLFEPKA